MGDYGKREMGVMGMSLLGLGGLLYLFGRKKSNGGSTPLDRTYPLSSEELPPGFRLLRLVEPNLTGRDVRAVQQALYEAGFYLGSVHGVFDYLTSEAVKAFQKARRLTVTGIVDANTWLALGVLVKSPGGLLEVAPQYVVWRVGGRIS